MLQSEYQYALNKFSSDRIGKAARKFIVTEQGNPGFLAAVVLHRCQFSVADYTDELFAQESIIFPASIQRAVIKRRAEFFAGRYCAQQSLRFLNDCPADIHIGQQRNPLWPPVIVGSISHSDNCAVAVTAFSTNYRGIGIDIQTELDADTCAAIRSQILFGEEYSWFLRVSNRLNAQTLLSVLFSVKESFFKAAYLEVGRYFDCTSISIIAIEPHNQTIQFRVNEGLSDALAQGTELVANYKILPDKKIMTLVTLAAS